MYKKYINIFMSVLLQTHNDLTADRHLKVFLCVCVYICERDRHKMSIYTLTYVSLYFHLVVSPFRIYSPFHMGII